MNKYFVVLMVLIVCSLIVIYTQRASSTSNKKSFKHIVQNEFRQYKVIEKNESFVICEINSRNELEEFIVIRIDSNQKKNIRTFGRRVTFTYSKQPSLREMRKDFAPYLSNI